MCVCLNELASTKARGGGVCVCGCFFPSLCVWVSAMGCSLGWLHRDGRARARADASLAVDAVVLLLDLEACLVVVELEEVRGACTDARPATDARISINSGDEISHCLFGFVWVLLWCVRFHQQ